jgi:hypothetical protein
MKHAVSHFIAILTGCVIGIYVTVHHTRTVTPPAIVDGKRLPSEGVVTCSQLTPGTWMFNFEGVTNNRKSVQVCLWANALNMSGTPDSGAMTFGGVKGFVQADREDGP